MTPNRSDRREHWHRARVCGVDPKVRAYSHHAGNNVHGACGISTAFRRRNRADAKNSPRAFRQAVAIPSARILWRLVNCVAHVAHRVNQRWITDLLSQTPDENFHQLSIVLVFVFPDAFAEFSAGKDTAWLAHEYFQQHQLACGQFESARAAIDLVIDEVQCKIANAKV